MSWDSTKKQDIDQFATVLESNGLTISQSELQADGWRLESAEVLDLLAKLRSAGTPLGEYVNNKIYMGVKTGLNEVFVISKKQRDDFIAEDPASVEVIKPFLRGKDVKRWSVDFAEQYIIFAKRGFSIDRYPAIRKYLEQYRIALSSRATINSHPWYELQQPQEGIYQEFEQPKIIYPDIYEHQSFAIDTLGFYSGNTCYFIPIDETWLCGPLNSQLIEWFYAMITNSIRGGYLRAFSDYMKQIPIPNAPNPQCTEIEKLVQKCLDAKKCDRHADTSKLENAIDTLVYQLYGLTEEEIKIVEEER
ncbi:MAG: hypothetical protein DCF20_10670 [Pseudanabaena sp.]|nr:MAG: hypothetical protein DCF20_10670 [Pseudanabaena sp.]